MKNDGSIFKLPGVAQLTLNILNDNDWPQSY